MLRRLLLALTARLPAPRVIYDRAGLSPYLSRWYLIGRPKEGFDEHGDRAGAEGPHREEPFGLYIHKFHRGDDDQELHNHPWRWSLSLMLWGGYVEERRGPDDRVTHRTVHPMRLNIIRGNDFHRVALLYGEAWSLFLAGPRTQGWGFWNRDSKRFTEWKEFLTEKRFGLCACGHYDFQHHCRGLGSSGRLDAIQGPYPCDVPNCGCKDWVAKKWPAAAKAEAPAEAASP